MIYFGKDSVIVKMLKNIESTRERENLFVTVVCLNHIYNGSMDEPFSKRLLDIPMVHMVACGQGVPLL